MARAGESIITRTKDMHIKLLCDSCHIPFIKEEGILCCPECGKSVSTVSGIVDLVSGRSATALDDIDYDCIYKIDVQRSKEQFLQIRKWLGEHLPRKAQRMLEIGAGTGGLTVGLLADMEIATAVLTDISVKMLSTCKERVANCFPGQAAQFITHSGVENCFEGEAFDFIIGSFVLHHILDFDRTLSMLYQWLDGDGVAVFLEPNGTSLMAMVGAFSDVIQYYNNNPDFEQDLFKLSNWVSSLYTGLVYAGERKVLEQVEDKHSFSRQQLDMAARAAGFEHVEVLPYGLPDCGVNAAQVYLEQLGLSDEGLKAFYQTFLMVCPRAFSMLEDRDNAASYAIVLKKSHSFSSVRPLQLGRTVPVYENKVHSRGHICVSIQDGDVRAQGWVVGMDRVQWVDIIIGNHTYTTHVGASRLDVLRSVAGRFPLQNTLFSGFELCKPLLGGSAARGSKVDVVIRYAGGGLNCLKPAALDSRFHCEFLF